MELDRITARNTQLEKLKSPWLNILQDCADYVLPRKSEIATQKSPGGRRNTQIYDATAVNSNRIFAAGLFNGLCDPTRVWFRTDIEDQDLKKFPPVKQHLEDLQRLFYLVLSPSRSNFYNEVHEAFLDMGAFGLPVIYQEGDPKRWVRFSSRHISEVKIALDAAGMVDTLFREFRFTLHQAKQAWDYVTDDTEKHPDKEIKVLHATFPRESYDPERMDAKNRPYGCVYADLSTKKIIKEDGYYEFPYTTAHWSRSSTEVYARSPAMDALPEIQTANQIRKTIIKAGHRRNDPPIFLPDDGFTGGKIKMTPGAVNIYRAKKGQGDIVIPNLGGDIQSGQVVLQDSREAIREAFFVNFFLALMRKPNITATQAIQIDEEKMGLLSPMIGRIVGMFDGMFHRLYGVLGRGGYLPEPPPELEGQELTVKYVGPLAMARQMSEATSILRTYEAAGFIAQADPMVMDNFNDDWNLRRIAEINGMPTEGMNDMDQVQQMRQARFAQEDAQEAAEGAAAAAGAIRDVARAEKDLRPE